MRPEGLGSCQTCRDYPNDSIAEKGQNHETWRLEETCVHSNSSEKPSANTDMKNSKGVNINNDDRKYEHKLWYINISVIIITIMIIMIMITITINAIIVIIIRINTNFESKI